METDLRLERTFERVELVRGVGDRAQGKMCIMSFVACLAGEEHTDFPASASPVIRSFIIPINDAMPSDTRQRLKPFAPRILGTADEFDALRGAILRRFLTREVLPRATDRYPAAMAVPPNLGLIDRLRLRLWGGVPGRQVRALIRQVEREHGPGHEVQLANAAGRLIALCGRDASESREADWFWNAAIRLLDQLCLAGEQARGTPGQPAPARAARSAAPTARATALGPAGSTLGLS